MIEIPMRPPVFRILGASPEEKKHVVLCCSMLFYGFNAGASFGLGVVSPISPIHVASTQKWFFFVSTAVSGVR
jgi:hypothetical protein